jgi:hypothetical protein|tara:strand:+ start:310 stop:432 length:123 start_codon:yes stop_codon:yes gene_type:complete
MMAVKGITNKKKTSVGKGNVKTSSMNKDKRRNYKKYRGQG